MTRLLATLGRSGDADRNEALAAAGVSALVTAVLVVVGLAGPDVAAHVYQRSFFLQHGFTLWNNLWYSGRYQFITYSPQYYPLAAVAGLGLLAVISAALAAFGFTRSEEHTSELQSLTNLVCRLLLEKKKERTII